MQATQQPTEWASDAEIAAQFNLTTAQLRDASLRGEFPAPLSLAAPTAIAAPQYRHGCKPGPPVLALLCRK